MTVIEVPEWLARLAAEFLRELSERMSNDGCNDYNLPDWIEQSARDELQRAAQEDSDDGCDDLLGYNWIVVGAVADLLCPDTEPTDAD